MNVFMTVHKSMTIHTYIHSSPKRVESTTLLDSGATENFMNLDYTKCYNHGPGVTMDYPVFLPPLNYSLDCRLT